MNLTEQEYNELSKQIIGAAIEVHKELGPGLLESVYETCLISELIEKGLHVDKQVQIPVIYKGKELSKDYFIDILVEDEIVVEVKSLETILPVHEAQLLSYLRLADKKLGLLINFNVTLLKEGVRRKVNGYLSSV